MNEYLEMYMAEAKELLDEMNEALLLLEKNMDDKSLVNSIFRAAHTIKGNSASMGFKRLESLTHGMEDLLQDIREGKLEADAKIMELLFVCHDFLENGLCTIMQTGSEEAMNIDGVLGRLHLIIKEKHEKLTAGNDSKNSGSQADGGLSLEAGELDSLKSCLDAGEKAYLVNLGIAADCIFKPVRVWMWLREMDAYLTIIKSQPELPVIDGSNSEIPAFEGDSLRLLVVTALDVQQLQTELNKLLDSSEIKVESFLYNENKGKQVKLVEFESEFSNDFTNEILDQLIKMDEQLDSVKENPGCTNAFNKLARQCHTIKGIAGFISNGIAAEISAATEMLLEYYRKADFSTNITDIGLLTGSAALIRRLCIDQSLTFNADFCQETEKHLNLIKISINDGTVAAVNLGVKGKENGQVNVEVKAEDTEAALQEAKPVQTADSYNKNAVKALENSFIRVSTQKIDSLVDMLGELLIQYSLMEQEASARFDSNDRFMNNLLRMAKVIKGVQNASMSLRMVALKQALQKIMRVGRDTAAELGKHVEITISGEETEIDRNIADKLVDPLMHLVRNSVSHGIENVETRRKAHKPEAGQIHIRAYSKRGYVYIEVEDDGGGLSIDRIRSKAIEKGLIDPCKACSEDEIMRLIFLPGFSTQEAVNNISGRGVGMNVVETEIKKVSGKIDIVNKPGEGCCFILKIPLNLAVMNGTIVDIFGGRYIIPTLYIKQFVKPQAEQWLTVKGQKTMIRLRDQVYPVIQVGRIFGREEPLGSEDENMVVIIEAEQKFKALPVRNITGRQEIVAKPLDKELGGLDFASWASILGDGKVSLILDVEAMFKEGSSLYQAVAY